MDPHDVRMSVGNGAMDMVDALDQETLDHYTAAFEANEALMRHLMDKGLPRNVVAGMVIGAAVAPAIEVDPD